MVLHQPFSPSRAGYDEDEEYIRPIERYRGRGLFMGVEYSGKAMKGRVKRMRKQLQQLLKDENLKVEIDDKILNDFYTMFFFPTLAIRNVRRGVSPTYLKLVNLLSESEMLKDVRKYTMLRQTESEMAATEVLSALIKQQNSGSGSSSGQLDDETTMAELRKLLRGIEQKLKEQEETQQNMNGSKGANDKEMERKLLRRPKNEKVKELARRIDVKEVLKIISGIKYADESGTTYVKHSPGEKIDTEMGDEIERMSTTELVWPKMLLVQKLLEGDLVLDKEAVRASVGSLYVLIDRSLSMIDRRMGTTKMIMAEAIATKLFMDSKKEKRDYFMRFFDTDVYELKGSRKSTAGSEELIDYMTSVESYGGTDIERALMRACNDLKEIGSKDIKHIVLITDGEDTIDRNIMRKLDSMRIKLITINFNRYDNYDLINLSNAYFIVRSVSSNKGFRLVPISKGKRLLRGNYDYYEYSDQDLS